MKPGKQWFFALMVIVSLVMVLAAGRVVFAQGEQAGDAKALAQAAQNPIASMISVPVQSNFNFGMGTQDKMGCTLNVQPVIPMKINDNWNLITRVITPFIYQPEMTAGGEDYFGLGDINPQFYFATVSGKLIWGIGPQFTFPTASDDALGAEKFSAGPAAVILTMKGPWVYGVLANNSWSYAGNDDRRKVNLTTIQPFVNYNLKKGWYLTSGPVMTANWAALNSDDTWTVPIGCGIGRIMKIGKQPVNIQMAYYNNVEHPSGGADWQLRFQVQLMFPAKK